MTPKKLLACFTVFMVLAAGASIAYSYYEDASQFSQAELTPVDGGVLTPAFNTVDSVPGLRRSGHGNELDLLKALSIIVGITLITSVSKQNRAVIAMFSICIICSVIIAHPTLKAIAHAARTTQTQR